MLNHMCQTITWHMSSRTGDTEDGLEPIARHAGGTRDEISTFHFPPRHNTNVYQGGAPLQREKCPVSGVRWCILLLFTKGEERIELQL